MRNIHIKTLTLCLFIISTPTAYSQIRNTYPTPEEIARTKEDAKKQRPEAMALLGEWHRTGCGGRVWRNETEAIKWFRLAAAPRKGNPQPLAMQRLAEWYKGRQHMFRNDTSRRRIYADSSVFFYKQAAHYGGADDQKRLADIYTDGVLVPRDYIKALSLYRQAAARGSMSAVIAIGRAHEEWYIIPHNYDSAYYYYNKALGMGDPSGDAEYFVAHMLHTGRGTAKDVRRAYDLYTKSMQKGSAWGYYGYALVNETGYSSPTYSIAQNLETAASYYKIAADMELIEAKIKLTEFNFMKDFYIWRDENNHKYARTGNVDAILMMGLIGNTEYYFNGTAISDPRVQYFIGAQYENGDYHEVNTSNVERNYDSALHYYRLAAEGGNIAARYRLGYMYLHGRGVKPDTLQALHHYYECHRQDYYSGTFSVLLSQWHGSIVNPATYNRLTRRVNDGQADADTYDSLGVCFMLGDGVKKSLSQAARHFQIAAQMGCMEAKCDLANLLANEELHKEDSLWPPNNYLRIQKLNREAADAGSIRAIILLANEQQSNGGNTFFPYADKLRDAAEAGNATAQYKYCAHLKQHYAMDYMLWLLRAAMQGHAEALRVLGFNFSNIYLRPFIMKHAAEQDDKYIYWVAKSYLLYYPNYTNAQKWFEKDLSREYPIDESYAELANIYLSGVAGVRDECKAAATLLKGEKYCKTRLGGDFSTSLRQALGQMYEFGLDTVKPDINKACRYYCGMGMFDATELRKINTARLGCECDSAKASITLLGDLADNKNIQDGNTIHYIEIYDPYSIQVEFEVKSVNKLLTPRLSYNGTAIERPTINSDSHNFQSQDSGRTWTCSVNVPLSNNQGNRHNFCVEVQTVDGARQQFYINAIYKEKRRALVVGNSYGKCRLEKLHTSVADASAMADALRVAGYDVIECINLPAMAVCDSIDKLSREAHQCAKMLFFFDGHGCQPGKDFAMMGNDCDTIWLSKVIEAMTHDEGSSPTIDREKYILVDACRVGNGTMDYDLLGDFNVAFSTQAGKLSEDKRSAMRSDFTEIIVREMGKAQKLEFSALCRELLEKMRGSQRPNIGYQGTEGHFNQTPCIK